MKRVNWSILFFLTVFSLGGCSQTDISNPEMEHNIIIDYDKEQIIYPEEVAIYKAEAYQANEKLLYEKLMDGVGDEEVNAFGKAFYQYEGKDVTKSLNLFEVGAETGIYGGFSYGSNYTSEKGAYQDIIYIYDTHLSRSSQLGGMDRKDFGNNVNLAFRSTEDSLKDMEKLFIVLEMPQVQVKNIYALDKDTMNEHALKNKVAANWTDEDEAYLIEYTQVVDGIPLMNHMWTNMTRSEATETIISAIYYEKGLESMIVQGAVDACVKLETQRIILPEAAEKIMIELYKSSSFVNKVVAEEMDLYYIVLKQGEELRLVPAYVFCIAIEEIYTDLQKGEDITIYQYQHCVVNALNGELVTGSGF